MMRRVGGGNAPRDARLRHGDDLGCQYPDMGTGSVS